MFKHKTIVMGILFTSILSFSPIGAATDSISLNFRNNCGKDLNFTLTRVCNAGNNLQRIVKITKNSSQVVMVNRCNAGKTIINIDEVTSEGVSRISVTFRNPLFGRSETAADIVTDEMSTPPGIPAACILNPYIRAY